MLFVINAQDYIRRAAEQDDDQESPGLVGPIPLYIVELTP
jgi:hypothetical protein